MRYAQIRKMDISNGEGIGVSLFVQGCPHHCKGCFNQETWDFDGGKEFTPQIEEGLFNILESKKDYLSYFSILGGEPLAPQNIDKVQDILKKVKKNFPFKTYVWTGYRLENIKNKEILKYIDVLVDGPFVEEQRDITLKLRGSSNQRVLYKGKDF